NTMSELKQLIDESVYVYNNIRPHLSLNMRTPAEVHDSYSCPA
ncbi:integrase core domain-containing protein, partial [Psychrobacter sp.]